MIDGLSFFLPLTILIAVIVLYILIGRSKDPKTPEQQKKKKTIRGKDRNAIIKEANRRLSQNPKDSDALLALAELYYAEEIYDKAYRTYEQLIDMCATNKSLDEFDITLKLGLSAIRIKQLEEAYKSLVIARSMNADSFEVNYNLGYLEYKRNAYEKAVVLLNHARKLKPDHIPTVKYLGYCMFKLKKYKEAVLYLRKAIDFEPDDKEIMFTLGNTYHELGQNDHALKIFQHLRGDPQLGPNAALFSGTINLQTRQPQLAILDFEIGLRHRNIPRKTKIELKYRLAQSYLQQQEISQALTLLDQIQDEMPAYKDVPALIRKFRELNANRNLQTYLISGTSDFVTLCRKIAVSFFPQAKVKIVDVSVQKSEYADILAEVSTKKWEDIVLFRFVRTTGTVGELLLRDLYSRSKDLKAGRGFCLSAGDFSDGAKQFVEARLIDLIEKEDLLRKLKSIDKRG